MTTTPKHRLRWYQFTIRSLLVLMVVIAIGGSWFAWKRQQVERQRAAVKAIEELGGRVEYDYQYDATETAIPNAVPPGPAWVREWLGDGFFAHVVIVYLNKTKVTDTGLEHLKGLSQLESLYLQNTKVTDAGLEHLKGFRQLELLNLHDTRVTDAGLEHLKGLNQLKVLDLDNTKVTDTGLEHLKGWTHLEVLNLFGTQVTPVGVKRLQEALPNCKIYR